MHLVTRVLFRHLSVVALGCPTSPHTRTTSQHFTTTASVTRCTVRRPHTTKRGVKRATKPKRRKLATLVRVEWRIPHIPHGDSRQGERHWEPRYASRPIDHGFHGTQNSGIREVHGERYSLSRQLGHSVLQGLSLPAYGLYQGQQG